MGKLSLTRLVFALAVVAVFVLPPVDAFAKKNFLERLLSPQPHKTQRHHKPRSPKKRLTTPVAAPIPEVRPDNEPPVDAEELGTRPPDGVAVPAPAPAPAPAPVPIPEENPEAGKGNPGGPPAGSEPDAAETVPVPEPNPRAPDEPEGVGKAPPPAPSEPSTETGIIPLPEPNPRLETKPDALSPGKDSAPEEAEPNPMLPDPRTADRADPSGVMPADELSCRARLKTLGVDFAEHKAESDTEVGCTIPYPLVVTSFGKAIALAPGAEMNCAMAEAAARFSQDVILPAASAEYGAPLKSLSQASAYVCRPRHGTLKLSEHAFGNALDIAAFNLADGKSIDVEPKPDEKAAKFLDAVRKAACGPFKTVLGPGSDSDHALHFHLDLEPRRNGGTYCH